MDGKTHTMMMVKAFFYAAHPSQFVAGDVKQRERSGRKTQLSRIFVVSTPVIF